MRRGVGISGLQASQAHRAAAAAAGSTLDSELLANLKTQTTVFQSALESFAKKHATSIQSDPAFRARFHSMCASVGVDPLTSSKGRGVGESAWGKFLPGVVNSSNAYYHELSVVVTEITLSTRAINGGILDITEVLDRLATRRISYTEKVEEADVEKAVQMLSVLGSGFAIVKVGKRKLVRSVPVELSMDQTLVIQVAGEDGGKLSVAAGAQKLGWPDARLQQALDQMMQSEMCWVDLGKNAAGPSVFWFLGMVKGSAAELAY